MIKTQKNKRIYENNSPLQNIIIGLQHLYSMKCIFNRFNVNKCQCYWIVDHFRQPSLKPHLHSHSCRKYPHQSDQSRFLSHTECATSTLCSARCRHREVLMLVAALKVSTGECWLVLVLLIFHSTCRAYLQYCVYQTLSMLKQKQQSETNKHLVKFHNACFPIVKSFFIFVFTCQINLNARNPLIKSHYV